MMLINTYIVMMLIDTAVAVLVMLFLWHQDDIMSTLC